MDGNENPVCDSIGVVPKLRLVIRSPGRFFGAVHGESGWECPLKYFLFLLLLQTTIGNIFAIILPASFLALEGGSMINPLFGLTVIRSFTDLVIINVSVILSVAATGGIALLVHAFLRTLGVRGRKDHTFKAVVYAYTPIMVLTAFGSVAVGMSVSLDLAYPGQHVSGYMAGLLALLPIPFAAWTLLLAVKGITSFHGIGAPRALLSLVLSGSVVMLALYALGLGSLPL
jgi:hypothetical protein